MGVEPTKSNSAPSDGGQIAASPLQAASGGLKEAPKVFSITQYNKSVERLLRGVPKIWVKGVITQLNVRGKVAYLTLGEFEDGDAKPRAVLEVMLWTSELEVFNLRFAKLPTPLTLRVELKVAFLLEASFYVPSGRFQPRVVDIDENFTIGELSLTRQKIIEKLLKEGLLEKNKKLDLADWPLRVGLISAPGSAGYQDFTTVLLKSGFSFRIAFVGAKMQGDATEATVLKGLEILGRMDLDVICIVRGGGAKTDLVYFDSESICRAIAHCRIPVLTGIGHEIDNSLADLVAFGNMITPTDCAKFLENKVAECFDQLRAYRSELSEAWTFECQQAWHEMAQRASSLKHNWEGRKETETLRCREQARTLGYRARQTLGLEARRMRVNLTGLLRGPQKIMHLEKLLFANKMQAIGHAWRTLRNEKSQGLRECYLRLREKTARRMDGEKERQTQAGRRLGKNARGEMEKAGAELKPWRRLLRTWWRQGLQRSNETLALKDKLVNAADPARMLGLGYSILKTKDGKLVRGLVDVRADGVLINQLKDGVVESRVTAKHFSDEGSADEKPGILP